MARILVIDDDRSLVRALRLGLRARGHEVTVARDGEEGLSHAFDIEIDVIVLDLGLPDVDGLIMCRRIREWSAVPIIVLSANDSEDRKVAALNEGADDYVTKPFGMEELEARIRTAMRHSKPDQISTGPVGPSSTLALGTLSIDIDHRETRIDGDIVQLTAREFEVLAFLMQNPSRVCTHQMILAAVWGASYGSESQYLHVYINRLRHKLRASAGVTLKTLPGIGYLLTAGN